MASPRVAHCLFCDDIRFEVGNKYSFMGIYSGEMIFAGSPPVMLPRFGIVTWVIADADDPVKTVSVLVRMLPDGAEIIKTDQLPVAMSANSLDGAQKMMAQHILPISSLLIQQAGLIEVTMHADGEALRAGRLVVRFTGEAPA
jgi:hypothetical protein